MSNSNETRHEYDPDKLEHEIGWNIKDLFQRSADGIRNLDEKMHHHNHHDRRGSDDSTASAASATSDRGEPTANLNDSSELDRTATDASTASTSSTHSIAKHDYHGTSYRSNLKHTAAKKTTAEEYEQMQAGLEWRKEMRSHKGQVQGGYYSSKYMAGFEEDDVRRSRTGGIDFKW